MRETAKFRRRNVVPRARIDRPVERDERRREQLLDVRCTDRAVVRTAEPDVSNRRKLSRYLIGVGVVGPAGTQLVIGLTIAGRDRQLFDKRMPDDRDLRLGERFEHPEGAADRECRSALPGEIAGDELIVRVQIERFLAIRGMSNEAALAIVNDELDEGHRVCGIGRVEFVEISVEKKVDSWDGEWEIVKIDLRAMYFGAGPVYTMGLIRYTAFFMKGKTPI